jgi:hypothetical protein
MLLERAYKPGELAFRVRYAIAAILRDRVVNEGAFRNCFEMEDADQVVRTILRRGLKNPKLRTALERSHLIDITKWLLRYPDLAEAYYATEGTHLPAPQAWRVRHGPRMPMRRHQGRGLE